MPEELTFFDADGADRVAKAARLLEEQAGNLRSHQDDARAFGASVAVRITGAADTGHADMYPGAIVAFKGGGLEPDTDPAGSVAASIEEWTDNFYSELNEDAEQVNDCWVIVSLADVNWDTDNPLIVHGMLVGESPVDGRSVVLVSHGGTPPPPYPPYPLTDLPCLVTDGYGAAAGLAQIWYDPTDGTAECKTSGFCGCPPADPPSVETSCCPLWYCTPDGPVEVSADADGVYTPPEGWDGTEPHLSEAAALEACPLPPVPVTCPEPFSDALFPGLVYVTVANPTGGFVGKFPDNSIAVPVASIGGGASAYGQVTWTDAGGVDWIVGVLAQCGTGVCISSDKVSIEISLGLVNLPDYGCTVFTVPLVPAAPWASSSGGTAFGVCRDHSSDYIVPSGELCGTLNYSCSGLTGTIDVYVST